MDKVRCDDFKNYNIVFGQNKTVVIELFCFFAPVLNV